MPNPIRIILADDHKLLREGFKTILQAKSGIQIVADAHNGALLLDLLQQHEAEIVITDIRMPVVSGIEACSIITQRFPNVKVIALSTFDDQNYIIEMLQAGAKGYLLKNADEQELCTAIQVVNQGGTFFCRQIEASFSKLLAMSKKTISDNHQKVEFSQREIDILELSCKELTNKEIAAILKLSVRTIEAHKERMLAKI